MLEKRKEKRNNLEPQVDRRIAKNEVYLKKYFDICLLLQEKRKLRSNLQGQGGSEDVTTSMKIDVSKAMNDINDLNARIKRLDSQFNEWLADEFSIGTVFPIEEFVKQYNFNCFEKKVFLFFLFLELCQIKSNICEESELLFTLDTEDSYVTRLKNMRLIAKESALIRHKILTREYVTKRQSATVEYSLTTWALEAISKVFNDESVDFEVAAEKREIYIDCDEGIIKQPNISMQEIILAENTKSKILFFLKAQQSNKLVEIGITEKFKSGKGLVFLLYGPGGTGKSMTAEAIAKYLNKQLLVVQTPKIMSRWVGETDKNILNMFKSAKENDAVLLLDEADSLLYNRVFATQEHEIRFVNDMLQEIDRFEGVAVFTTNMDELLDPALERRLSLKVKFELPDEKNRSLIWKSHIPSKVIISSDVDFYVLAQKYEFSGGCIKNAVLNALRKVVLESRNEILMSDLMWGATMEQEGMFNKERKTIVRGFAYQ